MYGRLSLEEIQFSRKREKYPSKDFGQAITSRRARGNFILKFERARALRLPDRAESSSSSSSGSSSRSYGRGSGARALTLSCKLARALAAFRPEVSPPV